MRGDKFAVVEQDLAEKALVAADEAAANQGRGNSIGSGKARRLLVVGEIQGVGQIHSAGARAEGLGCEGCGVQPVIATTWNVAGRRPSPLA